MRGRKQATLVVVPKEPADLNELMLDSADDLLQCCKALEGVMTLLSEFRGNSVLPTENLYFLLDCLDRRMRDLHQGMEQAQN
ncbi:DUF1484 family protein [Chromobacterium haemolyticum]|nr:DUF1484 family protein [Chromobacterium haemolyticum]